MNLSIVVMSFVNFIITILPFGRIVYTYDVKYIGKRITPHNLQTSNSTTVYGVET